MQLFTNAAPAGIFKLHRSQNGAKSWRDRQLSLRRMFSLNWCEEKMFLWTFGSCRASEFSVLLSYRVWRLECTTWGRSPPPTPSSSPWTRRSWRRCSRARPLSRRSRRGTRRPWFARWRTETSASCVALRAAVCPETLPQILTLDSCFLYRNKLIALFSSGFCNGSVFLCKKFAIKQDVNGFSCFFLIL